MWFPTAARIACAASLLLFAGLSHADTVVLQPSKDNTLYEPIQKDDLEDRSNGAGKTMFAGRTKDALNASGQVAVRRAVLAFDIAGSGIPAGSTIDSVTLDLRCTKAKLNTSFNFRLHELLSDWGEGTSNTGNSQQGRGDTPTTGDATWQHTFYDTQFWTTSGGDYDGTASATTLVGGQGDYMWGSTSGMVADVQNWLDNPSQNFGWILVGDESQNETAKQFATRENTDSGGTFKPVLTVNYTTQQISGGCCQGATCTIETPGDCSTAGGVYQGDGTSCSPNPCVDPAGACCASNGTCTDVTQSTCVGTFQGEGSTCATVEYCPIQLTPYLDALPVPGPATPVAGSPGGTATYDITMKEFQQQLHAELPATTVWGYHDGFAAQPSTPGPLIEARTGNPVTVNWINDIRDSSSGLLRTNHYLQQSSDDLACIHGAQNEAATVVHLHGGHVPAVFDGYPESTFLPGAPAEQYDYPNSQQAAPLWFHDHALGITRLNVYMGLAGLYLLRDAVEDAINLPAGEFEIPLVLQDRRFNPDGTLFYPPTWQDHFFGDKVMVNGKVWPFLNVKKGKYRFRLLNGSGSRVYTLSLNPPSGTLTFTVIGNEGGLLEQPANGVGSLTIGPGERYEVVVDFASFATNDEILLENSAPAPFPNGTVDLTQVMKFVVTNQAGDTDPVPNPLRTIERLQEGDAGITRDLELKKSGLDACGRSVWEINGLHWDDVTEVLELGSTEIWRFINDSGVSHPMHMHLVFFQILDRDGFTRGAGGEIIPNGAPQSPPLEESGWKDTAMVGPNEILRVIARFEDYTGLYAYHCHILEHEDHEMMRQFYSKQCGNGVLEPEEPHRDNCGVPGVGCEECDDGNTTPGDCCSATCTFEDADGDTVCDSLDNCPTVANTAQTNSDGDALGDACDNCVKLTNPPVATPVAGRTYTGGQLDDDADGYGNRCDGDFSQSGTTVGGIDTPFYTDAVGKNVGDTTCQPGGASPCDQYDISGGGTTIGGVDTPFYIGLIGSEKDDPNGVWVKCPQCGPPFDPNLPCVGDACP
ncbi:MAG: multicopper oxidase domain-containing protein [Planctomycetota bacterium]|jgi:spore coat protein A